MVFLVGHPFFLFDFFVARVSRGGNRSYFSPRAATPGKFEFSEDRETEKTARIGALDGRGEKSPLPPASCSATAATGSNEGHHGIELAFKQQQGCKSPSPATGRF